MNEVIEMIGELGIIPVVKIINAKDALPLVQALVKGGLPIAEITFRTEAAEEAISDIASALPKVLVGAGTILSVEQAKRAVGAGAKFLVSPGFNRIVVEYCVNNRITIIPGCSNPSDIEMAIGFGLDVVKFFPAEAFGGLAAIKAISAPYGMIRFIPTGGIGPDNINDYLAFNKIIACGGSWMVKEEFVKKRNFGEITRLTQDAINLILGFELAHIGINAANEEESLDITKRFSKIFNMPSNKGSSSNFVGTCFEVNKGKGLGKNGHVAIKTNNIKKAVAYLYRNGFELDMSTAQESSSGDILTVYLKEEIGGFAIHLLQK